MSDFFMHHLIGGIGWPLLGLLFGAVLPPLLWPQRRAAAILLLLAGGLFYANPLCVVALLQFTPCLIKLLPATLFVQTTMACLSLMLPLILFVAVLAATILLRRLCHKLCS